MSQQQNFLEPSSSAISSNFDDRLHYRPLRTLFTPAPYRSPPFHTSTISLPDIKEATTEENESSCSGSMEHNDANFHDHYSRKSSEQNLKVENSNNLVAVDHQVAKENACTIQRYCHEQPQMPSPTNTFKSSAVQVHEVNSNFKYSSDSNAPPQKPLDACESPRSYSSDSNKQPKSILKQRSVSLLSPSSSNINDNSLGRYIEKIQISDSTHKEEKEWRQVESYANSGHVNQPSSDLTGRENRLYQVMQENLRQQKLLRPQTSRHLPQASFNGPFFTLEEVHTKQHRESLKQTHQIPIDDYYLIGKQRQNSIDNSNHKLRYNNRSKSVSVMEVNVAEPEKNNEIGESDVHWPSPPIKLEHERARSVPPSLRTRNITDPDRIDEYHRQKELELEAMRRKEEEAIAWEEKQLRALELQERLYYQQMQGRRSRSSSELDESITQSHEELRQIDMNAKKRQNEFHFEKSLEPQLMHVYETRPITMTSEKSEQPEFTGSSNPVTWKRLYIVDQSKPAAKNEIITSEQLLEKERFDIDLLKRREVFIEKPKPKPVIFRTGKRWKPPPEPSYIWPYMRKEKLNAEPSLESSSNYSTDNTAGRIVENTEFRWQPIMYDPEYKQEHKNFTPENSLPGTPRGFGPGPLDEPAKRQIKHLIQPLPDGSHRPKPVFGGPRATPSGGFYPHAPNAIKVLKKKHSQSLPEPIGTTDLDKEVEIIHQRRFHRLGELPSATTSSQCYEVADWEKIYDLPVHSSTITSYDMPRNVNVRGKLAALENSLRQATPSVCLRLNSGDTHRPPSCTRAINIDNGLQSPTNIIKINRNGQHLRQQCLRQQLHSGTAPRTDSNHRPYQQQRNERQLIPSHGLLVRQINHRNAKQCNRIDCSNSCQQFSREILPSKKLLYQNHDHNHRGNSPHQHHIPIFRSDHTSTQPVQSTVSVVTKPRRLTRIPVNTSVEERLSSRTSSAITEWQRSSSIDDYLNTKN
ncbi:unnamed protein product [Acanthocheilonema viteae]|uniref:Uncharacterized protein n=1 Tax=Acanthocheilonema viteae TaxID=6277 RepID=A0A498SRM4_ACAVI|nr:unnamed protein product [Acanthocheilonema viteae]